MKRQLAIGVFASLLSSVAFAADLGPMRGYPQPTHPGFYGAPVFTWTGFYVGGQVGYAWGEDDTVLSSGRERIVFDGLGGLHGDSIKYDIDGVVGGAHAGFNLQSGNFVIGIEGDLEASGVSGERTASESGTILGVPVSGSASVKTDVNWMASVRGRLGFTFDRLMVYGTGGVAFADIEHTYTASGTAFGIGVAEGVKFSDSQTGWTLGGGLEYAVTSNMTTRVEYRYTQFGSFDNQIFTVRSDGVDLLAEQEPDFHTVRAGVSFKW